MSDLIDRKEILHRLDRVIEKGLVSVFSGEHLITAEAMKSVIEDLPSADPEIIRCKACRHSVDYYHDGDCYCSNPKWGLMYFCGSWEFYCADAERRTDE